jgi:hypothetical protein
VHQRAHALHQALVLASDKLTPDRLAILLFLWLRLLKTFIIGVAIGSHIEIVIKNS